MINKILTAHVNNGKITKLNKAVEASRRDAEGREQTPFNLHCHNPIPRGRARQLTTVEAARGVLTSPAFWLINPSIVYHHFPHRLGLTACSTRVMECRACTRDDTAQTIQSQSPLMSQHLAEMKCDGPTSY
ncbi:unnamed protein product [Nezara viridula]|uniref:Uncharacterized protein n=1 Tax=Nezara viridula TaxID=85310 RepID=A0A9P0GZA4_NEZVI|nr:unnamed protein product [Nezara viridula]